VRLIIVGGSDAGISARLCARELDPDLQATVLVADGYPNLSICGIPYHISERRARLADPRPPHPRRPGTGQAAAARPEPTPAL
jgi:NADPH-dependent 2,4-dienoyl-CoA reductase/sulfur reductase-like enzyme